MASAQSSINAGATTTRRATRVSLELDSFLILSGERVPVTVLDLSHQGVRLEVSEPLFAGEVVELELGRSGYVRIRICWCQGSEAGAVFLGVE